MGLGLVPLGALEAVKLSRARRRSGLVLRRSPFSAALLLLAVAGSWSCSRAPQPSGELLYRRYCASCHGLAAKGDGPVAASLHRRPSDLTRLAAGSGGRFDENEILAYIDGRRSVAEHGPREMPVWGELFDEELRKELYGEYTTLLKSRELARYLGSIQEQ